MEKQLSLKTPDKINSSTHLKTITPIPESDLPVHERKGFYLIVAAGCLMSFQAGFINVISIVKTGITISHNTGTSSKLGISMANMDLKHFILGIELLLSFVMGSALIGFFIRKKVFHFNRKYGIFLIVEALFLYFFKLFLDFDLPDFAVLFGTFACGVQNALLTNLSGAVVRTTHVSGLLTDTGLILGHFIRGRETSKDIWRMRVLLPIISCFILGGAFSRILFNFMGHTALMFSVITIGLCGSIILSWRLLKRYRNYKVKNSKHGLLLGKRTKKNEDLV